MEKFKLSLEKMEKVLELQPKQLINYIRVIVLKVKPLYLKGV